MIGPLADLDADEHDVSDRQLVDRHLRHCDESTFRQLYRRHTPALYGLAVRLLAGDTVTAEDAVHDTWLRAVGTLDRFTWRSSLKTWLSSILINRIREGWRRAGRRAEGHRAASITSKKANSTTVTLRPETIDLERAVAELAPRYRQVVVLHDIEGYTHDEIGTMLGIAAGTAKSQLSRARAILRQQLGNRSS